MLSICGDVEPFAHNAPAIDDSLEEIREYGTAIVETCRANGSVCVLCDETGSEYGLGTLDTFKDVDTALEWLQEPAAGTRPKRSRSAHMRSARAEDLKTLLDLMADFYAEAGYVVDRRHAQKAFAALLADPRLGRIWLIEQGPEAVGHIVVTFVFAMEYGGHTAVVDDFYVRPAFRGAGLGTAALAEVRRACAELGMRAMRVEVGRHNAVAQSVYRRVGFEAVDHQLMTLPLADPTHVT